MTPLFPTTLVCAFIIVLLAKIVNKKARDFSQAFVEEHLEKSSPLIIDEIARWHDLLWDDYLDYKQEKVRRKKLVVP